MGSIYKNTGTWVYLNHKDHNKHRLEFVIHSKKSILKPTQKTKFPGFFIDSRNITVANKKEKADHIIMNINENVFT